MIVFLSSYKNSLLVPLFAKFLGSPFLFSHLQCSLWVTSWLTLQYLATSARKNLCVPATITQAERVFSWMEWLLKKEGFVCQENLSTCNYSWRTVWALDCFCHCDVFSTINWLLSFLEIDFQGNWIHISHFWIYHL